MTNYRNSKLIERYEDVVFELETALNVNVANDARQKKDNHRFVVDNSGESTPFDWYHARLNLDITLEKTADGANVAADDHNGIVNSAFALIKKLNVKMNGVDVYDCSGANQATNIKNLIEYSQGYSKSQGTNELFHLDTNRHAEERSAQANYNSGFAARKLLLNAGATVNAEIPLNRYSFFESLHSELLPNSRIEIKIDLESDNNVAGKENKQRLQTLSIDNAWSNKNFLVYLTFRMLQHTSSEVNGYNCYKHLKIQKIKRGTGDRMVTREACFVITLIMF